MTGWEVERRTRTACRSASIPAGGSSPMPSPSQGAERRPERHVRHAGSRLALRVLVIGGLAGVAWLLTGTAANAVDHDVEPVGSLSRSTMDLASMHGDEPMVRGALKAAAQPLEPGPELARPRVVSEPVEDAAAVIEPVPADVSPAVEPVVAHPVAGTVSTARPVAGRTLPAERVRFPLASDIDARGHDAGAPTVSPD